MTALRAEGCGIAAFGGDEYKVSVTGFTFVSTVMHDEEPPSPGRGLRRHRKNSFISLLIFSVFLRASPSSIPVGQAKGKPFYGQAKGQLCPTWQSYAGLPPEEGACITGFTFMPPLQHGVEQKPPSQGRGRRQATEEQRGLDDRSQISDCVTGLPSRRALSF